MSQWVATFGIIGRTSTSEFLKNWAFWFVSFESMHSKNCSACTAGSLHIPYNNIIYNIYSVCTTLYIRTRSSWSARVCGRRAGAWCPGWRGAPPPPAARWAPGTAPRPPAPTTAISTSPALCCFFESFISNDKVLFSLDIYVDRYICCPHETVDIYF